MKNYFISFIISILIYNNSVATNFNPPELDSISKIEIIALNDSIMSIQMELIVRNPNPIGANLTNIESKIFIDNQYIGTGNTDYTFQLKPNDTTRINFISKINIIVLNAIFDNLLAADSCMLEMVGDYSIKKFIVKAKKTGSIKKYIRLNQLLQQYISQKFEDENTIKVISISPKAIGPKLSELIVRLEIKNEFPFNYQLSELDIEIKVHKEDIKLANATLSKSIEIPANENTSITMNAIIDNEGAATSIGTIIFGKQQYADIVGIAKVVINELEFKVPINQKKSLKPPSPFGH